MGELKVYVWDEDFLTDWTSGCAIAIAPSLDEAKALLIKRAGDGHPAAESRGPSEEWMREQLESAHTEHALAEFCYYMYGGS